MVDPQGKVVAMSESGESVVFQEIQQWSRLFRGILVLGFAAIATICVISVVRGPDELAFRITAITSGVILPLGLALLIWIVRMETQVRTDGVYVRYFPFHLRFRRLAVADFDKHFARTYHPLREYGGWGIRWGFAGRAYNVSGNQGVQIVTKNGKRILIGSHQPRELDAAIDSVSRA